MLTRAKRAFTLLELIVVIVILGILAALAIPTFAEVISRSEGQGAKTSAEAVARNAVAIAAFDNAAPGNAHIAQALTEVDGVTLEAGFNTLDSVDYDADGAGSGAAVTYSNAVVMDVDGKDVLVQFPAQKNGAAEAVVVAQGSTLVATP